MRTPTGETPFKLAYRTPRSSSGYTPFTPSSRVLMIFNKDRFATSACPLACGWEGEE